ncbi:hypothetical protein JR316_0000550 [Psilocybe cubensis]|uniref:Uncharacterized protein n=2 Tax=Psilocybe cubensis TaxID=181762 RepID=A0A8H7Y9P8_PSICU|nr:hypothetical protein JR316_0000550 [Psilocybe cubensis]KAH9486485.1 hypothetical protein JR316_0000550 [Psilocybe cubensis]
MASSPEILQPGHHDSLRAEKWDSNLVEPRKDLPSTVNYGAKAISNQTISHVERKLGETEVSYFLPSRESGVNDMYLHLGCRAPSYMVDRRRVGVVWAIMRVRHPLLASKVKMNDYEDIVFSYDFPQSTNQALVDANQALEYRTQSKDDLIDAYLNGPRTLSDSRLSYLIVSSDDPTEEIKKSYDFLICATHFLGDGMALHQFANDFFLLLGSSLDLVDLNKKLFSEWSERYSKGHGKGHTLPSSMEDRLTLPSKGFARAASRVDFEKNQQKLIGGHTFPRQSKGRVHTVVPTVSIGSETTKKILANCKRRGVTISSALFAICNVAWHRTNSSNLELPMMMYSALNMRPNLMADKRLNDSYWFLAIGYFNVVLPTFFPREGNLEGTFWFRARSAKIQSIKAAKSPLNISRCYQMAKERGRRARIWAKEDDDKLNGRYIRPPPAPSSASPTSCKPNVPSNALIGLSLLGNLDGTYKHAAYPEIKLHTLTTGSRQRSGGMLLFGYTFVEKLWVSLGYDENGFEEDTVKRFWKNVLESIDEFLLR